MAEQFDIIIRHGLVVDGSGDRPFEADIAISDGVVVKIGQIDGAAEEEIDASGKIVTPGFVDLHTHYDGQVTWSDEVTPSSLHGVTTVVMGNCGVGFAPCRASDRETLINLMEGVEDIPEVVMSTGLPWNWETFPEYLDALDARVRDIDIAAYIPHSPLRVYVMGDRAVSREAATAEELAEMQKLVGEAIDAGAVGFGTSRLRAHRSGEGEHIPSFEAAERELEAIGDVMVAKGQGVLQLITDIDDRYEDEILFIHSLSQKKGLPVTFTLVQGQQDPETWRWVLDTMSAANASGGQLSAQIFPRPVGMILSLDASVHPFCLSPTYCHELRELPLADRVAKMREPAVRARLLEEMPNDPTTPIHGMARNFASIYPLTEPSDYEPAPDRSVAALAAKAGRDPLDFIYDGLLEEGGRALFYSALANYADGSLDAVLSMMKTPGTVLGLGDGGAHYGVICDASYPTFVLTHWTRDRAGDKLELAEAVRKLAFEPAQVVGLRDRGLIAEGYKADVNIIDYDKLQLQLPHVVQDLPGEGRRLMQAADGYVATIVSGQVIRRNGEGTGRRPGRLVRGAQHAPGAA